MRFFLSSLFLLLTQVALAGLHGEVNTFYATDSFKAETSSSESKTYYSFDIYANLNSKGTYFAGFHLDQVALQETAASSTARLTSLNMGPMVMWLMDRKKEYGLSLGYNIVANGAYTTSSASTTLSGTGLFVSFSAMPEISENFYVGLKLNYYSLSFSRSIDGSTVSPVSFTRTLIFPSLSLAWRN
jgi:hypothetical protein